MKKITKIAIASLPLAVLVSSHLAFAATNIIQPPADLPVSAMSYGNVSDGNIMDDPNIVAALIGVVGLFVGSAITIFATIIFRNLDIKREDKKEEAMLKKDRKEKEYQIKQEIYRNFLHELADLETFDFKDFDDYKKQWTKTEVKVDLIASGKVRNAKEVLQAELLNIAEKNIKARGANLSQAYLKNRDALLDAIREEIDLNQ